jgi:hypothetical protein
MTAHSATGGFILPADCILSTNRYHSGMPNLLIRNLPPELHARLKAQAKAHRRSLAGETVEVIEKGLGMGNSRPISLPDPIVPRGKPVSTDTLLAWIDDGLETRGTLPPK